jgi:lysophospholipase L1-like esterase
VVLASTSTSGADPRAASRAGPYYVAIGASESVGLQPVPWEGRAVRTDQGYADVLRRMEQRRWPGLQLVDYGCPGITAQGALDGTGACQYPAGSQIATAAGFIAAHPGAVAFVTVDLGFNDIAPCLGGDVVDETCVDAALGRIASAIPAIVADLRAAGGPGLLVVGLQHADPYVADSLFGKADFARRTVAVFDQMNALLAAAYGAAGAVVAHVPASTGPALGAHAVEAACTSTWMCTDHNIHPTAAGYRAIADAVADAVADAIADTRPGPPGRRGARHLRVGGRAAAGRAGPASLLPVSRSGPGPVPRPSTSGQAPARRCRAGTWTPSSRLPRDDASRGEARWTSALACAR